MTDCIDSRGELFLTNQSLTWVPNSMFQLGLPNEMALGLDDNANYGFDTVTLGWQGSGLPTVQHSTIAGVLLLRSRYLLPPANEPKAACGFYIVLSIRG